MDNELRIRSGARLACALGRRRRFGHGGRQVHAAGLSFDHVGQRFEVRRRQGIGSRARRFHLLVLGVRQEL